MSRLSNFTDDPNGTVMVKCKESEEQVILWNCISTLCFVFGFPGSFAVLLHIFQKARKGTPFTPNDVFVFNLTVMDGIYLLFLQIEMFVTEDKPNLMHEALSYSFYSFSLCGRPLLITCISLDCYLAVVHPVTYRRRSLTPRLLMSVGVWTVSAVYGCYFGIGRVTEFDIAGIYFYILTLPVIGFCDISILWTLKRSSPGKGTIHPQKKKALQIIYSNFVITLISYLPIVITFFVNEFFQGVVPIVCLLMIPVVCFTIVGTVISVMLYLNNLGKLDWLKCWMQK